MCILCVAPLVIILFVLVEVILQDFGMGEYECVGGWMCGAGEGDGERGRGGAVVGLRGRGGAGIQ